MSTALLHTGRVSRALLIALVCSVVFALSSVAASLSFGDSMADALRSSSLLQVRKLRLATGMDSWAAMWSGLQRQREHAGSPYERTWALDQCKFQYPPSALLLLEVLPEPSALPMHCVPLDTPGAADAWTVTWSAKPWISVLSALAVLGTVAVSWQVLRRAMPGTTPPRRQWLLAGAVGLAFAPLLAGHVLGQVQVFMNLALALAMLALMGTPARPARRVWAGALVGLCCLLKPQYLLFLVWAALRRERRFGLAMLLVFGTGTAVALAMYGIEMHLQFVDALRRLSQTGEVFWLNQTLNGVLNRLLHTGDIWHWEPPSFPAYHPVVRWGTLAGALLLIGAALAWRRGPRATSGNALDFATMLAALTIASPIGWDHHYGCFLPIFALLLGLAARNDQLPRPAWLALGFGFVAMATVWRAPEHIFTGTVTGLLGSHMWFGALAALGLLFHWRGRDATRAHARPAANLVLRAQP